jgi:hypothetical protein
LYLGLPLPDDLLKLFIEFHISLRANFIDDLKYGFFLPESDGWG